MNLSDTMVQGLVLAAEQGRLVRQPGGFWTPPDEPMKGGKRGPQERGRHVGKGTVKALMRRDCVDCDTVPPSEVWLTEEGREALVDEGWRECVTPDCDVLFEPRNARQTHHSPNCRKRHYQIRKRREMAEAVSRRVLERVLDAGVIAEEIERYEEGES